MVKKTNKNNYQLDSERNESDQGVKLYLEKIVEIMPGNVYWMDKSCVFQGCNKNVATTLGLSSPKEIVGKTYEDLSKLIKINEYQHDELVEKNKRVMETGMPEFNVPDSPVQNVGGKLTYFLNNRVPVFDSKNNEIIGMVGVSIDITEYKELEQQLTDAKAREARFKAMSSMGGMIAHELRTPLAAIKMAVDSWKNTLPKLIDGYQIYAQEHKDTVFRKDKLEALERSIHSVERSVGYADNTIHTILTGFHYTAASEKNGTQPFNVKEAIQTAIKQFPFSSEQESWITVKDFSSYQALGHSNIIIHVLHNLLKNSLYAIREAQKGKVTIDVKKNSQGVCIVVEDTAKGISPEGLQHIFEPFYTTKTETAASIGLGLYFCRLALEKIGGSISCESVEDQYTRFTIVLIPVEE